MWRRTFLQAIAASLLLRSDAWAFGEEERFNIGLLKYAGNHNPRPSAIRRLLFETEKVTNVRVDTRDLILGLDDERLWSTPMLVLAGDTKFAPWSDESIARLRRYLQAGGMLVVDSSDGLEDGPFLASVRRELARVFPDRKIGRIPRDHVIFKSFYLVDTPEGRLRVLPHLLGVWDDERVSVVISANDLLGAWARDNFGNWLYTCSPGGERQRDFAFRLGVNLVMYALCINYKADQVHIPFILGRRKWKVE